MMNQLLSFLNQGWVGAVLGILGLGFGVYQIARRTGPRLVYQHRGTRLIEADGGLLPQEVVVYFDGKEVPRLSLSETVIWNAGKAPLRGSDISHLDPIALSFGSDGEILKANIEKRSRSANSLKLHLFEDEKSKLFISFEFLDYNDGAYIRVLHSGDRLEPGFSATIVGLPKGLEYYGRMHQQPYDSLKRYGQSRRSRRRNGTDTLELTMEEFLEKLIDASSIYALMGIIGLLTLVLAAFPNVLAHLAPLGQTPTMLERTVMASMGLIYGTTSLYVFWSRRRRFPASLAPMDLDGQD
jgi:hypothetical protein